MESGSLKIEKLNLINLGCCTLYLEMGLLELCGEDNAVLHNLTDSYLLKEVFFV